MPKITRHSLDGSGEDAAADTLAPETPARPVGEELLIVRERRDLTISDVSKALKIKPEYLEAIESGDIERLPARAYAVGFVRSYAGHLGLNARELADRYRAETAGRGNGPELDLEYPQERRFPRGALFLVVLLVLASGYGGYYLLGMKRLEAAVFREIAWSTETVLAETLGRIEGLGGSVQLLAPLSDVDTEADWQDYLARNA